MKNAIERPLRCGIVLSGGDGKRLQPSIQRLLGYNLPKQYVNFIGTRSMLEHTYARAERVIPSKRIHTVLSNDHLCHEEVQKQIRNRDPQTLAIQPQNKETGPGLLLPLIRLFRNHPNSSVAVFPSDHFIIQEELFCSYVRLAFEIVEKCPSQIVFLGVKPDDSEPEYGYLIPENGSADKDLSIQNISIFLEKPERSIAEQLIVQGALWNTMVMVFKPEILLHLVKLSAPKLYQAFQIIFRALGDPDEDLVIREVYKDIEATNLSKDLLAGVEAYSRRQLSVLPMNGVFWSDWGTEERIISVLRKFNYWNGLQKNCELSDVKHPEMAPPLYLLQDAHA